MANAKPTSIFAWATNPPVGALLAPSSALVTNGYSLNSKPTFNNFNWLFNVVGQWLAYVSTLDQVLYGPSNPPPAADWSSITGLPADIAYLDKAQLFTAAQIFGPMGTADDKTESPVKSPIFEEDGNDTGAVVSCAPAGSPRRPL